MLAQVEWNGVICFQSNTIQINQLSSYHSTEACCIFQKSSDYAVLTKSHIDLDCLWVMMYHNQI